MHHNTRSARVAALLAGLTLLLSAVAVTAQSDGAEMPAMAVEVSGIGPGEVVTANDIALTVTPVGYEFSPAAGTAPVEGRGHYHVMLDGGLVNMFTTAEASVSLQNVAPGEHVLMVVPAMNNHMGVIDGGAMIPFDYQPEAPLPDITGGEAGATPTISIESPANGDTVSGDFDITISTTDFTLSEELFGKPNLDAFGHWHVFIDAAEGMGTMAGMAGGDTFTVSTEGLTPGPHTFIAVLVDNLHAPFDPPIAAMVQVEVAAETATVGNEVVVSLQEFSLTPSEISLAAGPVTFVGVNDGSVLHALAIEGDGVSAATPDASYASGSSQSFTVELAPGTYQLICPVPGHKDAGMLATVTVSG